jgi:hypothetical protein
MIGSIVVLFLESFKIWVLFYSGRSYEMNNTPGSGHSSETSSRPIYMNNNNLSYTSHIQPLSDSD